MSPETVAEVAAAIQESMAPQEAPPVRGSEDLYKTTRIETSTGLYFNPFDPQFHVADIVEGLSKVCRFNGQCSRFYSVAEHSVLVARIMDLLGGDPREGLLHDASEAYLPDVPAPYKALLPDLHVMEKRVDRAMRVHFKLPAQKSELCGLADIYAVLIEANDLLPSNGATGDWLALAKYRPRALSLGIQPLYLPPDQARRQFLNYCNEVL